MSEQQEGVTITLRDVYDISQKTHEAVTSMAPRMNAVEEISKVAMDLARVADERSRNNERFIKSLRKIGGTVLGGTILTLFAGWVAKHIH